MIVPPVPMPATKMSTLPSVSFQISSAVVSRWISGLASLANCRARTSPGAGRDLLGLGDGALHPPGPVGEDELGAEGPQQGAALLGHGLGHGQDDVVAARRTDHRQRDAGVAAGRLDDGAAGLELAGLLGGVDDRDADAVLHPVGGVVELELGGDGGAAPSVSRLIRTSGVLPKSLVTSS